MGISYHSRHKRRPTCGIRKVYQKKLKLYRAKTLVNHCTIAIDAMPSKQWYDKHYDLKIRVKGGRKVQENVADETEKFSRSKDAQHKYNLCQEDMVCDLKLDEQLCPEIEHHEHHLHGPNNFRIDRWK
eukprot:468742_1